MMGTSGLVLCLVLGLCVSLVSATSGAPALDVQPTMAPLRMSSAKPTVAPMIRKSPPTKAMIINRPPTLASKKVSVVNASEISNVLPTVAPPVMNFSSEFKKIPNINIEPNMSTTPNTSEITEAVSRSVQPMVFLKLETSFTPEEKKERTREMDSSTNVAQVTGFITGNGNIYEIEDSNGLGTIEVGRQMNSNKCEFGSLIIYSDIPCDKVTNIKTEEIQKNPSGPLSGKINKIDEIKPQRKNQQAQHKRIQQILVREWHNDLDDYLKEGPRIRQQQQSKGYKRRIVNSSAEMRHLNNKYNKNHDGLKTVKTQLQWNNQQKLRYQKQRPINNQNRRWNKSQKRKVLNQSRQLVKKNCVEAECNGVSRRVNDWVRSVQKFL